MVRESCKTEIVEKDCPLNKKGPQKSPRGKKEKGNWKLVLGQN